MIQITEDNSPTVFSEKFNQTYHSIHGAINESNHVFIKHGLEEQIKHQSKISIFEMGFGTGLNAALTWEFLSTLPSFFEINYETIELYPIEKDIWDKLILKSDSLTQRLKTLHTLSWESKHSISNFQFQKRKTDLLSFQSGTKFDLIYFDAFSPEAQPELWTDQIFSKLYDQINPNGRLCTYCAKGEVKRALKRSGFTVSNPPGPKGKREMTVAMKM